MTTQAAVFLQLVTETILISILRKRIDLKRLTYLTTSCGKIPTSIQPSCTVNWQSQFPPLFTI